MQIDPKSFAIVAHGDQKYGDRPYVVHLSHVHQVLVSEGLGGNAILAAASWLHDVVEDTKVTLEEVEQVFGNEVADIVGRVTDEPGESRKERKLKTYPKIRGHRGATIIKLCDRIANVEASREVPKKFTMYKDEYPEFRAQIFVPDLAEKLWKRLDSLLVT